MYIDRVLFPPRIKVEPFLQLLAEVILLNTGQTSKTVALISHFNKKRWENSVQVEKYQRFPLKFQPLHTQVLSPIFIIVYQGSLQLICTKPLHYAPLCSHYVLTAKLESRVCLIAAKPHLSCPEVGIHHTPPHLTPYQASKNTFLPGYKVLNPACMNMKALNVSV